MQARTIITPSELKRAMVALDRELVRRHGFAKFVELAWEHVPINVSTPYVPARHIDEMCKHAEAMIPGSRLCPYPERASGESEKDYKVRCKGVMPLIRNIVVNIPPGYTKSMVWSVMLNAWIWTFRPEYRIFYASFDHNLSMLNAQHCRDLIRSAWYVERWGNILDPIKSRKVGEYWTKAGGLRFSTSIGGKGTGRHFHGAFVDDPIKPLSAETLNDDVSAQVNTANMWLQTVMASRTIDANTYVKGVIMQRLHDDDPSARLLAVGAVHLCLPARYDPDERCTTPVGGDWRTCRDEMLEPVRFSRAAEDGRAKGMGGWDGPVAQAQLQQQPAPPGGLIFKKDTFGKFQASKQPSRYAFAVLSIDCNFKKNEVSSDVGFTVAGLDGGDLLVYHAQSANIGFLETVANAVEIAKHWGCKAIMIEDKANGPAVVEMLRKAHYTVIAVDPKDSKEARAHAANILYQAGRVKHNTEMVGLDAFESALGKFPRGKKKDIVDSTTQILLYLGSSSDAYRDAALAQLGQELPKITGALGGFGEHFYIR